MSAPGTGAVQYRFPRERGRNLGWLWLLLTALPAMARADWTFSPAEIAAAGKGVFHHMDASGRQALALSDGHVAITWEDDRTGVPRCYLGIKAPGQAGFREQAFGRGECFAPGITALSNGRFGIIWEDESGVNAAQVQAGAIGEPLGLAVRGGQGAMAWHPTLGLMAAWTAPEGRWQRLWLARLKVESGHLDLVEKLHLESGPIKDDQMYPALAATASGFALAWEDRRLGHTVIFSSRTSDGQTWSPPGRVSQNATGKAQGTDLGRGTGAMRPSLASLGADRVAAVWLDKRDFLSGYDVYAALPESRKNIKAQDSFGDAIAQWHPAVAGTHQGQLVVAWDDDRDGTADIWITRLLPQGGFGENWAPPPAAGPDAQSDPVVVLGETGDLHLAWIERDSSGLSSIRYSLGITIPKQ